LIISAANKDFLDDRKYQNISQNTYEQYELVVNMKSKTSKMSQQE
jgi:hypothetical protein